MPGIRGGSSYVDTAKAAATPDFLERRDLACRRPGVDPEWFYPGPGGSPERAKAVCALCPARAACLDWALGTGQRLGVWGGTTEADRQTYDRRTA